MRLLLTHSVLAELILFYVDKCPLSSTAESCLSLLSFYCIYTRVSCTGLLLARRCKLLNLGFPVQLVNQLLFHQQFALRLLVLLDIRSRTPVLTGQLNRISTSNLPNDHCHFDEAYTLNTDQISKKGLRYFFQVFTYLPK